MPSFLTVDGPDFKDPQNRVVTLRGINVAADAKLPTKPDLRSHIAKDFFDGDNVSFVGRPFSLEESDIHFQRLRNWGYNTIRYVFTWEAIEARGPGIYDEEFIDSTIALLRRAKAYDFMVYMDPHQDVWSRFSGGSGAPMWTLYAMGLDPRSFEATEAALVHNIYLEPSKFPKMIWSTNYQRLACLTIFTLFFAGKDFAPKCILDGKNIQDYLTEHFVNACVHLAKRIQQAGDLEDFPVIGWESINEPNRGLIGYLSLDEIPGEQKLQKGTSPTAWQAILTGAGRACEINTWDFGGMGPYKTGKALIDPKGVQAWLASNYDDTRYGWKRDPGWKLGECIWAQHGVWDPATNTLLKPDYFCRSPRGELLSPAAFTNIYFIDHYRTYQKAIRAVHQNAIIFCQPPVLEIPPAIKGTDDVHERMVYTPHYYDGITLMTKKWNRVWNVDVLGVLRGRYWHPAFAVKLGEPAIRDCLRDQLKAMRQEGVDNIGLTPCMFSEIGIPYDMDDKNAYRTGNYSSQIRAMDANHYALEGAKVAYSLWTYVSINDNTWGDQWNGEDLSIFCLDDRTHSIPCSSTSVSPETLKTTLTHDTMSSSSSPITATATRAVEAFVRPAPICTAGTIISYEFALAKAEFHLKLDAKNPTEEMAPTEIFVPVLHFPKDSTDVTVTGGKWDWDEEAAILRWWHAEGVQEINLSGPKRKGVTEEDGYYEALNKSCVIS